MSTARVLVVEDESIIALDIQTSLQNAGYQVVSIATCAEEALNDTAVLQPDLILMDIRLRGEMDGVETAEQIRQTWQLPVIFLTAHADENTLLRAKKTQPFGYILKPFEDRELITMIEIALSRHKAESLIKTALRKEKEINELKSRFVSVVSHEFRNPLNTILFSTELLQRYGNQISDQKKETYLERIQGSVKRMNELLSDVLTVGETEAGKLQFSPQPLDVIRFCKELVDEFHLSDRGKSQINFSFRQTSDQDRPSLSLLDERLLRHILTNLLSNALKYSPSGDPIEFKLNLSDRTAIFRIQDHGIGIPKADQIDLFQSFHRARNAKTIPGTGLGLSIVKQCVDLHGGTITVESEENQGTLFTVTLPLNRQSTDENNSRN
ncbi:hybrid sensor histidine kinase/response regulator [Leptolyngbya sp. AN03gr2]|uniref:hybrid sensor histidine kinase/response regulator n=1 Tax=unclassified Leptolyngbya TaxID=2650499 RepID=UPI003D322A59